MQMLHQYNKDIYILEMVKPSWLQCNLIRIQPTFFNLMYEKKLYLNNKVDGVLKDPDKFIKKSNL